MLATERYGKVLLDIAIGIWISDFRSILASEPYTQAFLDRHRHRDLNLGS